MSTAARALFGDSAQVEMRLRARIDRICAKDPDALAQLYDETSSRLYGLAMQILNDPSDAEEIVLDVYQKVWQSAHTFDASRGTVWSWLTILTRSRAIDCLRIARLRRKLHVTAGQSTEFESDSPGPEAQTIRYQKHEMVGRAMENLSDGERAAIELAYFRGLTHVEIAEELGEPLGTIKTRIRSGVRKLRDAVEPLSGV